MLTMEGSAEKKGVKKGFGGGRSEWWKGLEIQIGG